MKCRPERQAGTRLVPRLTHGLYSTGSLVHSDQTNENDAAYLGKLSWGHGSVSTQLGKKWKAGHQEEEVEKFSFGGREEATSRLKDRRDRTLRAAQGCCSSWKEVQSCLIQHGCGFNGVGGHAVNQQSQPFSAPGTTLRKDKFFP